MRVSLLIPFLFAACANAQDWEFSVAKDGPKSFKVIELKIPERSGDWRKMTRAFDVPAPRNQLGPALGGLKRYQFDIAAALTAAVERKSIDWRIEVSDTDRWVVDIKLETPTPYLIGLPLSHDKATAITLRKVKLHGTISDDGTFDGLITGVISKQDIDRTLVPALFDATQALLKDFGKSILPYLDDDKDGTVTADEFTKNRYIRQMFAADSYLGAEGSEGDYDAVSFGFGFQAKEVVQ